MARSDVRPRPAMERHAHAFYAKLVENAEERDINGETFLVFEGPFSRVFRSVVGNQRYYTSIRKVLLETGSVEILQKGNSWVPTVAVLHFPPPDQEIWPEDLTGDAVSATMRKEFERRLRSLETWRENLTGGGADIIKALRDFEDRIASLEKEVATLKTANRKGKVTNGKTT